MGRHNNGWIRGEGSSLNNPLLLNIIEHEIHAHNSRYNYISREIIRNVPWSILILAVHAELRSEEVLIENVARHEEVTESLILRWAKAMAAQELISIRTNAHGKMVLELQARGRKEMDAYLTSLWKPDT